MFRRYLFNSFMTTIVMRRFARKNIARQAPQMVVFSNDYIGHWLSVAGGYEHEILEPAIKFIAQQRDLSSLSCIDIGANIGNHAVFFANYFKNVIAIEANPSVFPILRMNAGLKNNIEPINAVMGEKTDRGDHGRAFMMEVVDPSNVGTGRVIEISTDQMVDPCAVLGNISSLDDLIAGRDMKIGLIKIDVEGNEQKVLNGSVETITRHKPVILFEFYIKDVDNKNIMTFLDGLGYKNFHYVGTRFSNKTNSIIQKIAYMVCSTLFNSKLEVRSLQATPRRDYNLIIATT